jgi:hypothetical protein
MEQGFRKWLVFLREARELLKWQTKEVHFAICVYPRNLLESFATINFSPRTSTKAYGYAADRC